MTTRSPTSPSGPGTVAWCATHFTGRRISDAASYVHVIRWAETIWQRPAVQRGRRVNRTWGPIEDQLAERHDASDFDMATASPRSLKRPVGSGLLRIPFLPKMGKRPARPREWPGGIGVHEPFQSYARRALNRFHGQPAAARPPDHESRDAHCRAGRPSPDGASAVFHLTSHAPEGRPQPYFPCGKQTGLWRTLPFTLQDDFTLQVASGYRPVAANQ